MLAADGRPQARNHPRYLDEGIGVMTVPPALEVLGLSPAAARQIDRICDRFEREWQSGRRPPLEEFLGGVADSVRPVLLRQLLPLDCEYRARQGACPSLDDYLN